MPNPNQPDTNNNSGNPNKPPRKPGKIVLPKPKEVILVPERTIVTPAKTKTITEFNILTIQDFPSQKKLVVVTEELGRIVLFEDQEYDKLGQWTDDDLINRLTFLYQ